MSQPRDGSSSKSASDPDATQDSSRGNVTNVLPDADAATRVLPSNLTGEANQAAIATVLADQASTGKPDAREVEPEHATGHSGSAAELQPGTVINNRFVINGLVGRGGMGEVYRVKDLRKEETNDRDPYVAMKVLNDQFQRNSQMIMAMQREARKAQSLAHPNIGTVYDFDRDDQLAYLTMELLEGQPLDEFIKAHPNGIPRTQAHTIIRGLSLGLAYAHNRNIIHSDFKPANIFLTDDSRTKILDFGIARAAPSNLAEGNTEDTRFDAGTLSALTPAYASCEMLEGEPPHPADDVFALAIVTYQLLAGRHPFGGKPATQARALKLAAAQVKGLKRREWRAIQHGLTFDRSQRTQHAAAFLREFEGASRTRVALIATVAALALASTYLVYEESRKVIANQPDTAFSALPADAQQQFQDRMDEGQMLESFNDYSSALDQYTAAYRLHPKNPQAVAAIEALFTELFALGRQAGEAAQLDAVRANLADVRAIDAHLANRPTLSQLAEQLDDAQ